MSAPDGMIDLALIDGMIDVCEGEIIEEREVDIDFYFGLSYASYLVVNRSLLQSMPVEWQHRFTKMLDEMWANFANITEPNYRVHAFGDDGRFVQDPIPNYNRGRTYVAGVNG